MDNKILRLNDKLNQHDEINRGHHSGFWAKTQIIGGYDHYVDKNGISQLGEVVFETTNLVPLIGVQYAFEKIFGVTSENISSAEAMLNNRTNIPVNYGDNTGTTMKLNGSVVPGTENNAYGNTIPTPYNDFVYLFGVGCDGDQSNNIDVKMVDYKDIDVNGMIPFRHTTSFSATEKNKYYGRLKLTGDSKTCSFLKKIDTAKIHHILKNGSGTELSTNGDSINPFTDSTITESIESYLEAKLVIDKTDFREWFEDHGHIEYCRLNSIGLYSGYYDESIQDYTNIRLFSKLNIPNEPLSLTNSMTILYRVYGA